jgi:putative spermidine/putrescine transport system ATP-binding protein
LTPGLRLQSVSKRFGGGGAHGVVALNALSLQVGQGEFVALLGPSGCGKSTALNCVAGLVQPTSGSIWLGQERVDQLPPERRGFSMVFQSFALFPHMTVAGNVGFGLAMRRCPSSEIARRVQQALETVRLSGEGDRYPAQLSGGQQQRVALARAVVVQPRLLLMDEPLSNLDEPLRQELRGEIRHLHHQLGRPTLYVTHDQEEALSLADRIVVLNEGQAVQIASPQDVHNHPATLSVARFMGYRNVLPLDVSSVIGERVRAGRGALVISGTAMESGLAGAVHAAFRPDEVAVSSPDAPNAMTGTVDTVEYQGGSWLLQVALAGESHVFARHPKSIDVGTPVTVSVSADRVLFYR